MIVRMAEESPKPALTVRESLAANIRRIRNMRGLKGQELVAQLGELGFPLTASGLSEVETGKRRVSTDELLVFAIALNTSIIDLLLPAGGERLAVAQSVDPLEPLWAEMWLQGETPGTPLYWQDDDVVELLEEFLASASEFRKKMHRHDLRPEIAAIDALKEQVRTAIEAVESKGKDATSEPAGMVNLLKFELGETSAYVNLLANKIERDGYGG